MGGLERAIRSILDDTPSGDIAGDRAVEYVVRGIRDGRTVSDVLSDPCVRNRVGGSAGGLSSERVAAAVSEASRASTPSA